MQSPWLAAATLACAIAVVYSRVIDAPLIFDDYKAINSNESINSLWPLVGDDVNPGPLNPPPHIPTSARPLANLSLALNYAVGGTNPTGYRLVNIVLHFLSAMLLWSLVRRTLRLPYFAGRFDSTAQWLALSVSLLWALHPLQTEAVAYVTQRTELAMAFFYLATLYCSLRYLTAPTSPAVGVKVESRDSSSRSRHWFWMVLAIVSCAAGMISKEVMVSAPLMVLLYDRTFVARSLSTAIRKSWPLYLGLMCTWLPILFLHSGLPHSDAAGFHLGVSAQSWWFTQAKIFLMYLKLAIWPWPLVIHYELPYISSLAEALPYLIPVTLIGLTTLILLWRNTAVGFLGTFVFAVLSPTSIIPITTEVAAERRMYLPLAALASLVVVGGYSLVDLAMHRMRRPGKRVSMFPSPIVAVVLPSLLVVLAFAVVSASRLERFRAPLQLWLEVAQLQPENYIAAQNVGFELYRAGRLAESISWYRKAIRLNTTAPTAHFNLGLILLRNRRVDEAIEEFRAAVKHAPDVAEYHNNLGVALAAAGRMDEAIPLYRRSLQLEPNLWTAHDNWGQALASSGHMAQAIPHYQQALVINPDALSVYAHLADAYARTFQRGKAIETAQRALDLARSTGEDKIAEQIAAQLASYRNQRHNRDVINPASPRSATPSN